MTNIMMKKSLIFILIFAVAALGVICAVIDAALAAGEQEGTKYTISIKLMSGEMVPLSEVTVFGESSWSYSTDDDLVRGTFFFGDLPPRPDPEADRVALVEVSRDEGARGFLAVFERFPAGATLLLRRGEKLITEATITYNPEEL